MPKNNGLAATRTVITHLLDGVTLRWPKNEAKRDELELAGEMPVYLIDGLESRYNEQGQERPASTADTEEGDYFRMHGDDTGDIAAQTATPRHWRQSPNTVDLRGVEPTQRSNQTADTDTKPTQLPRQTGAESLPSDIDNFTPASIHRLDWSS